MKALLIKILFSPFCFVSSQLSQIKAAYSQAAYSIRYEDTCVRRSLLKRIEKGMIANNLKFADGGKEKLASMDAFQLVEILRLHRVYRKSSLKNNQS